MNKPPPPNGAGGTGAAAQREKKAPQPKTTPPAEGEFGNGAAIDGGGATPHGDSPPPRHPGATAGLRHLALSIHPLEQTEHFYTQLLGMQVEWRPDPDNVYLTSGNDNLALHRAPAPTGPGQLDHLGFFIPKKSEVDAWHAYLKSQGVKILAEPKDHRDGTRSFYCQDPAGNRVQLIHHPSIN